MKFCENCGARLEDDAVFCDECGTACDNTEAPEAPVSENTIPVVEQPVAPAPVVEQPVAPAPVVQQPVAPAPVVQQPTQSKKLNPNIIAIGVIAVVVLILLIVLFWVIGGNKKSSEEKKPSLKNETSTELSIKDPVEENDISEEPASQSEKPETEIVTEDTSSEPVKVDPIYSANAKEDISLGKYSFSDDYYYIEIDVKDVSNGYVTFDVYKENLISQRVAELSMTGYLQENNWYTGCPYCVNSYEYDSWLNNLSVEVYFSPNMQLIYYSANVVDGYYDFDASFDCVLTYDDKILSYDNASELKLSDGTYYINYWDHSIYAGFFYTEAEIYSKDGGSVDYPLGFYKLAISPDVDCYEWVDFTTTRVDIDYFYGDFFDYEAKINGVNRSFEVDIENGMIVKMTRVTG